ncbi:MAG: molybdenum cofactor biosynthesis protein MoaE, partial [Microbacterium sp.]|nr:molybdenum cofactor biosynthesis protein MoaE [Microbacterium sp.]
MTVRIAAVSAEPLDLAAHLAAVADPRMGAETSFVGRVRDHDPDAASAVVALEYSAHPDAEATLRALAERAVGETGAVVAVSHRVGHLDVGDAAVVIAVSAAHRDEAFTVCRAIIEAIKVELP